MFERLWVIALSLIFCSDCAWAGDDSKSLATLTDFIGQHTQVVKQSVFLYSWFSSESNPDISNATSSGDPSGFRYVQWFATDFWTTRKTHDEFSFYGQGLYTALNPSASMDYGKGKSWALVQIQLATGARFLDAGGAFGALPLSKEMSKVMHSLGCPKDLKFLGTVLSGGKEISDSCVSSVRKVMEQLKIVGFRYEWGGGPVCGHPNDGAIIITNSAPLGPQNVRIYTSKTQDDLDQRRMLQTLVYRAYQPKLDHFQPPTPPANASELHLVSPDLWPTFDGTAFSENVERWIQENLMGCSPETTPVPLSQAYSGSSDCPSPGGASVQVPHEIKNANDAAKTLLGH